MRHCGTCYSVLKVRTMSEPGIYLLNSTGEMVALHTESGDGDTQLLKEYMDENDLQLNGENDE